MRMKLQDETSGSLNDADGLLTGLAIKCITDTLYVFDLDRSRSRWTMQLGKEAAHDHTLTMWLR